MLIRLIVLPCLSLLLVAGALAQPSPSAELDSVKRWFKGNTHAHTVLSGHADSSPEHVAAWYHDRGYNFLILSEHNIFIDPDSVRLPSNRRDDFILIPGEEVTGNKVIHTTAMNIRTLVDWHADHEHKHVIIQHHVDSTIEAGGTPILNHPNFRWAVTVDDILPVRRLHMFELYNGHPEVHNFGDETRPSTEEMWDELLTEGMLIYGVSSDDAHSFQSWETSLSNPGRGWVMVRADELTPQSITRAMRGGDFYATNGVVLAVLDRGDDVYRIEVDAPATEKELQSPYVLGQRVDWPSDTVEGQYEISFIGDGGKVLSSTEGLTATYTLPADASYVRAKITHFRPLEDGSAEAFYAWTQPVFTDERAGTASRLGGR